VIVIENQVVAKAHLGAGGAGMDFAAVIDGVESFAAYVGDLANVIGHVGRVAPLHDYCAGLLASEGRRSVEPMAALTAPAEVSVQHQRLLHFVGEADWSDARVLMKVRQLVVPVIEDGEPIKAWIIDDTSYPKQGNHSVGVHHQYCGQLGKQANCQAAVTLSIANHHASLPIAHQLYLPKRWISQEIQERAGSFSNMLFTCASLMRAAPKMEATAAMGRRRAQAS